MAEPDKARDTASTRPAFAAFFRVRFHEVDALGHVNNASYLNYLEQAAIDHATFLGLDMERSRQLGGVFVVHRHEVVFHEPTFAGDLLRVDTWLEEPAGARVTRHYRIFREPAAVADAAIAGRVLEGKEMEPAGPLVVSATTEWVFATESGRPRRIPAEIVALLTSPRPEVESPQLPNR